MPALIRAFACLCLILVPILSHAAERERVFIVGHRGLLHDAPENTLANFRACLALRIGFEFDVRRTKDGALVCLHDSTVDRTTLGKGSVSEMTLAEIRQLDAGRWFDPLFAGEQVPTVDEVLKLVGEHRKQKMLIAVDLKAENVEEDVVKLANRHGVLGRLLFIGRTITEPAVREKLLKADPKAQVARLANNAEEFPAAVADRQAHWVYVRFVPTREQIEAAHRAKKPVFIAGPTVSGKAPDPWRQAAEVWINAILTDYPLELRQTLTSAATSE